MVAPIHNVVIKLVHSYLNLTIDNHNHCNCSQILIVRHGSLFNCHGERNASMLSEIHLYQYRLCQRFRFSDYSSFHRYLFLMEGNTGHGKAPESDDIKRLFVRFD